MDNKYKKRIEANMNKRIVSVADSSIAGTLAHYICRVDAEAIPKASFDAAKLFMLDTIAVAWAGSDAPGCPAAYEYLLETRGRPESTAWAYGARLGAEGAAFINGMTSSALDFDSLGRDAPVHVNIAVLPAALAMAERMHSSGKDFLASVIVGSDLLCRMAAATKAPHRGFHYTSTFGVFGAAAASARLLGLDTEATRHALGIAFTQASGTQQANIEPSLTKRMLSAFAARAGVFAASLAERGITAPANVIEGVFGLYNLYQAGDTARLLDRLGERFDNANLSIKKYPSCGCNHTAIEGVLRIVRAHDLKPDDVKSIEITVSPYIDRIVGMPYDPGNDPQVAAQFSIRYSAACALVRRRLTLLDIQADAARDPAVTRHVGKVDVIVDPRLTGDRGPVRVRIGLASGQSLACEVEHVPGSAESPLTQAEIEDKFANCFVLGVAPLASEQIRTITDRVRDLESISDMATFFHGVTPVHA
jgi:2-methylcitrate dehydratase PrpD